MRRTIVTSILLTILTSLFSCGDSFLDIKSSSNLVVPHTLKDFRELLDNGNLMASTPEMLEILADDYYFELPLWQSMTDAVLQNSYIWATDIYETTESDYYSWDQGFEQIFYTNVVLDGLKKIDPTENRVEYDAVKGSALFIRAHALYTLSQLYAPAFDPQSADSDLGLPIPLSSDVNELMTRKSVRETYGRILSDLDEALPLLGQTVDYSRPSRPAAQALKARVLLNIGKYQEAGEAAAACLAAYGQLTDLNVSGVRDYHETIYLTTVVPATYISNFGFGTMIDSNLYQSYAEGDLRKSILFKLGTNGKPIKGASHGLAFLCFSGLDTDEQYLIKAECEARLGQSDKAMQTLNTLLKTVYTEGFVGETATTAEDVLQIVLTERRKQLVFRGTRWSDLKRLNRDGANITLTRQLGETTYSLEPGSTRWLFPIPPNEIETSGIQQNLRE